MKNIQTSNFGTINYSDQDTINFPEGLPGFTKLNNFILVQNEDTGPFTWLQSVEKGDVSFVLVDPKKFKSDYEAVIGVEELNSIKLENADSASLYALVTLAADKDDVSMNLKAPIVINKDSNMGAQVILRNSDHDIEYKLFAPQRKRESLNRRKRVKFEMTV